MSARSPTSSSRESPLRMGLNGNYRGKNYEIVGRVQYQHPAGGVWDEWYLAFGGDRWGWLAEAQGRFYVTFEVPIRSSTDVPTFDQLRSGSSLQLRGEDRRLESWREK